MMGTVGALRPRQIVLRSWYELKRTMAGGAHRYAYIPVFDAIALYEPPAMMNPAAARSPAPFAASIAVCAAAARSAGVRFAVESK